MGENIPERALLKFDLAAIQNNTKVVSATLGLYPGGATGSGNVVYVHRLTRDWVEGTCKGPCLTGTNWLIYDSVNNWVTPGGDFDPRPAASATVNLGDKVWYYWDVSDLVADWITGNQLNYGMLLRSNTVGSILSFASSDDTANMPQLSVVFVCECGKTCTLPTNPIAHWLLDETSGLSAADAIGGHTGTLNGGTWTTGKLTGGLFLNGTNQFVSVANAADLSPASFTLAAWVKSTTLTGVQTVLSKGISKNNRQYSLATNGNQLVFGWRNGSDQFFTTTTANLQTNTWYHVAASYNAATAEVKVYLNGTLLLSQVATVPPLANAEGITLGRSYDNAEYWQGVLDDIWIQQGVMSAVDIAALAGAPSPGTPVTVTLSATADTFLQKSQQNGNFGAQPTLDLGGDMTGNMRTGLLTFGGISTIPAGATIVSAMLNLYEVQHTGVGPIVLDAHDITENWVETAATWKNAPKLGTTVISSATVNNGNGWKTWDVTPLVQEWVDALSPNYGIGLIRPSGSGAPINGYNSRESTALEKPQLVVTYQ